MSDTEKDRPDNRKEADSETKQSGGAVVISIEQARAELLAKPRQKATPQMGVARPRPRAREVPAPVTLPPGEHAAVIVTDTPAARTHVEKKTVHPGEMPVHTHEKKVRVKTSLDPRRAKTQITDRRAPAEAEAAAAEAEDESLRGRPSQPSVVPATSPSTSPPRPSVIRPKPIQRERGAPLFVIGVIIAAALGAAIVYFLSRPAGQSAQAPTAVASSPAPSATPVLAAPTVTATSTQAALATPPTASPSETTTETPAAATSSKAAAKSSASLVKPSAAPTATAKPTATSVLPFGVGHD